MAIKTKKLAVVPLNIEVCIPPVNPQIEGTVECKAKVRTPDELVALQERIRNGDFADDADLLRNGELFTELNGIEHEGGKCETLEQAMDYVTKGEFAMYFTPRLIEGYFQHFKEAIVKNSKRRPGR